MTPIHLSITAQTICVPGVETAETPLEALNLTVDNPLDVGWRPTTANLSPRAQKRLSQQTLLAIAAAEGIQDDLNTPSAWVFGSAFGEGETLKVILESLRKPDMAVRPLRFQNSVHNAASGQWMIAAQDQNAVTSICAGAATAGASLLKASMQAEIEGRSVGLVLFDAPLPAPLDRSHKISLPGSVGLAISPATSETANVVLRILAEPAPETEPVSALGRQAKAALNPALAIVPLLERLQGLGAGQVILPINSTSRLCLEVIA